MYIPLAEKIRPTHLDEIAGQHNILDKGMPLRNLIEAKNLVNMIFYGPPGTGKTSVARIAAKNSGMNFKILNCTSLGISDIKEIINNSESLLFPNGTLLYLDEIQYLNKKQQQILLETMENGTIKIIASTTENPYFSVYNAILSRCIVFEFKHIDIADIVPVLKSAISLYEKDTNEKLQYSDEDLNIIAQSSGGDLRKAVNIIDICILSSKKQDGTKKITPELIKNVAHRPVLSYDKNGDYHFDLLSAFQKSMRGSDSDAAIHYLGRLLEFGELTSICRRLLVCACEDVGLAYPQIIPIVKSATDIALQVGMPEARIPLADAVILVCLAPKSNSAYNAINKAQADIKRGKMFSVPRHLQNVHCDGIGEKLDGLNYIYPHDFPNHWVKQEYMPNEMKDVSYYIAGTNKTEQAFASYWQKIKSEKIKNE